MGNPAPTRRRTSVAEISINGVASCPAASFLAAGAPSRSASAPHKSAEVGACRPSTAKSEPSPPLQKTPQSGAMCATAATDPPQSIASISPPDSPRAATQSYQTYNSAPSRTSSRPSTQKSADSPRSPHESSPADDPLPHSADPICAEKFARGNEQHPNRPRSNSRAASAPTVIKCP